MQSAKQPLLVVSSFALDKITYRKSGRVTVKPGGPAFWISRTLQDLGVDFGILTGRKKARVEIIVDESGEYGVIRSIGPIKLYKKWGAELILISTIADEFKLSEINNLKGDIILDVQGYIRCTKSRNTKFLMPKHIVKRVKVLKATAEEYAHLETKFIAMLGDAIILITKGRDGVDIIERRRKYSLQTPRIQLGPVDAIGAGDVFLAAFTSQFIRGRETRKAAEFATQYTSQFLHKNKEA